MRELRERLLRALPELAGVPESVVEALDVVLSFDAWDRLRSDQKLSRDRAKAAVETAALALLQRAAPQKGRGRKR